MDATQRSYIEATISAFGWSYEDENIFGAKTATKGGVSLSVSFDQNGNLLSAHKEGGWSNFKPIYDRVMAELVSV